MYKQAWREEPSPSSELVAALSDDLNTPDAITHVKASISRRHSLDDQRRVALVHDARFLGVVTEEQRDWLTVFFLENLDEKLLKDGFTHFRDYRVFSANNDVEKILEELAWFKANEMQVLGDPPTLRYVGDSPRRSQIDRMREERRAAREAKDWTTSDRIREEFAKMGITVQDNPDGTMTLHYSHVGETGRFEIKGGDVTFEVEK
jgi:cysteinyl-tRNA synthetase